MGWKHAGEGSTTRAVAEHRLYGTIIEWELKTKLEIVMLWKAGKIAHLDFHYSSGRGAKDK